MPKEENIGSTKLSLKSGGTRNSIWVEITREDNKTLDSSLAARPRRSEPQGRCWSACWQGLRSFVCAGQVYKHNGIKRERMEAEPLSTPAYKAMEREIPPWLCLFSSERAWLLSAYISLGSGCMWQLSPVLSYLWQGNHGRGISTLASLVTLKLLVQRRLSPFPRTTAVSSEILLLCKEGWRAKHLFGLFKCWIFFNT